jgi:hypothetical protein
MDDADKGLESGTESFYYPVRGTDAAALTNSVYTKFRTPSIKDAVVNGVGNIPGAHPGATPAVPAAQPPAQVAEGQPANRDAAQQPELTQRIALPGQQLASVKNDGFAGQLDQVISGTPDSNQMTPLPAKPVQTGAGKTDSNAENNSENAPLRK